MAAVLVGGLATPLQSSAAPGPAAGAMGTVETVAGPGFCAVSGQADPASTSVRSLAVDGEGRLFFDTGRPDAVIVAMVEPGGRTQKLPIGSGADWGVATNRSPSGVVTAGRLAADGAGGVMVAGPATIVQASATSATVMAGNPRQAGAEEPASGDGGPIRGARFARIRSITADARGNLFVADRSTSGGTRLNLRFLNRGGDPVTFYAGTPWERTVQPGTIDSIADTDPSQPAGGAGGGLLAVPVDGDISALAVADARLYVAASRAGPAGGRRVGEVRIVNLGPTPVSAHGMTIAAGASDVLALSGPALGAGGERRGPGSSIGHLPGISADAEGRLYMADEDSHRIVRLDADGQMATVAGTGAPGFDGNGRPAAESRLDRPVDVKVGPRGRLYISDRDNGQIRALDTDGLLRAAPGAGIGGSTTCKDRRNRPTLLDSVAGGLSGVAADGKGNVFISLSDGSLVQRVEPSGKVSTVAGSAGDDQTCVPGPGCRGYTGDGAAALAARLDRPAAVVATPRGDIYLLDYGNARVRFVNLGKKAIRANGVVVAPGAIETVAGNGVAGGAGDGGQARDAELGRAPTNRSGAAPLSDLASATRDGFGAAWSANQEGKFAGGSLALGKPGDLYLADIPNHRVRRIDPSGVITTVAGDGAPSGMQSCCREPRGLALDAAGNLYVSDFGTRQVWAVNLGLGVITAFGQPVLPGTARAVFGGGRGEGAGAATNARLVIPGGIALDREGSLYVSDLAAPPEGGVVLKVAADGLFSQLMGNGRSSFNGDGMSPQLTSLNLPTAVSVDKCGNLLVADPGNDRVRRLVMAPACGIEVPVAAARRSRWWFVGAGVGTGAVALLVQTWRRRLARRTLCGNLS